MRQRECLKKTGWAGVEESMRSSGLFQQNAEVRNKWRKRSRGYPAKPGHVEYGHQDKVSVWTEGLHTHPTAFSC